MKHLKIYEDYTDEEIESLLSDLEGVGHTKSARIACVIKNVTPQQLTHPSWWIDYPEVFSVVNFVDRGTEEGNKRFALEKIKKGEFEQGLEALSPDEFEVMGKNNIQKTALESSTLDDFLSKVADQFVGVIFRQWEKLVEDYLETKNPKEVEDFFETTYWRRNPKNAWSAISEVIDPKIRIRVE